MEKKIKTIGVLTSGGDAPGMNAAVRSVVRTALFKKLKVVGIRYGYQGLLNDPPDFFDKRNGCQMDLRSVSGILEKGGTVLYSARSKRFREDEGVEEAARVCREAGIDGIVAIGGDGTFRGAKDLASKGISCVGIPATIDNDIGCTDYCIGFDTAMNTALDSIDKLRDTSEALNRCSVVQVMGRDYGDIALRCAIASGAISVLLPEKPIDLQKDVIDRMMATIKTGKRHFIIIVAEGVFFAKKLGEIDDADKLAQYIEEHTGVDSRATVIGHVQRGGSPSVRDRVTAARMGHYAVEVLLQENVPNDQKEELVRRVVAVKQGALVSYEINEALRIKKTVDPDLFKIAYDISI